MTTQDVPVACSLEGPQMRTREQQWKELLAAALLARRAIPRGVELRFERSSGTESQLRRLVALERECCRWIQWTVTAGDALVVELTASQDEGVAVLGDWFGVDTSGRRGR